MEKVLSSPDEEGHLLSYSRQSTHRRTRLIRAASELSGCPTWLGLAADLCIWPRGWSSTSSQSCV